MAKLMMDSHGRAVAILLVLCATIAIDAHPFQISLHEPEGKPLEPKAQVKATEDGTTLVSVAAEFILNDYLGRGNTSTVSLGLKDVSIYTNVTFLRDHYMLELLFDHGRVLLHMAVDKGTYEVEEVEASFWPDDQAEYYCTSDFFDLVYPSNQRYSCNKKQTVDCALRMLHPQVEVGKLVLHSLEFEFQNADPAKAGRGEFSHQPYERSCAMN